MKTKKLAGTSLFVMGAGFAAMLPFQESIGGGLLTGAFEAGLVGGLADWFAVTALFRHPLGIPIPHTALLPKNRAKMTEALVSLVENNLLNRESIENKLKKTRPADRLLELLEEHLQEGAFHSGAAGLLRRLMSWPVEGIWSALQAPVRDYVLSVDKLPAIRSALQRAEPADAALAQGLDYVLDKTEAWAESPEARKQLGALAIRAITGMPMNGLMQFAVNSLLGYWDEEKIGGAIQHALMSKLRELHTEGHPDRQAVLDYIRKEYRNAADNPEIHAKLNGFLQRLLGEWIEGDEPLAVLRKLQQAILSRLEDEAFIENQLRPLGRSVIHKLREDPEWLQGFNDLLQRGIVRLLEANHSKIGQLVRHNIDQMDNETLIQMVEEKAGKDLQWIRVNGAVCGFLLGLVLSALRMLTA